MFQGLVQDEARLEQCAQGIFLVEFLISPRTEIHACFDV